ncbi:hypothetical protein C1H46_030596 [Malus baccata]|uniref:Serine aminopeptidase S33 domain-containing protein n=1 Tax=Malus baccata TaxID=106549 RepID=A0A540LBJ2_MALBA|nr:hypothetical protein C1H46_030596 [Malus baccata]
MVSYVSALLYGVGGLVVAGMTLLVALQERLVYVPVLPGLTKSYPITPARLRLTYEDVWLQSSDGVRLHAWFIKLFPLCRGPTLLFFQENAGNIAHRLEMVRIMLQQLQCNVFMLSYRGYGASEGYPSQHGIIKDAQVALDHLSQRTDIDTSRIVLQQLEARFEESLYKDPLRPFTFSLSKGYICQFQVLFHERIESSMPADGHGGAPPLLSTVYQNVALVQDLPVQITTRGWPL